MISPLAVQCPHGKESHNTTATFFKKRLHRKYYSFLVKHFVGGVDIDFMRKNLITE